MFRKQPLPIFQLFALIAALALSGCVPQAKPLAPVEPSPTPLEKQAAPSEPAPTPLVTVEKVVAKGPDVFADLPAFQAALLQVLASRDAEKLQMWMNEPFITGVWRTGLSDMSPAEAVKSLLADQLGAESQPALVKDADLKALMGNHEPLAILQVGAGVTDAFLVSGWGKDGGDEAILFVARQADNSLKWHGWMQVRGGFSGTRLGGIKPYQNDAGGYSLYVPKDDEVSEPTADEVVVLAPGVGHPSDNRAAAFIFIEPANGRTAEQIVEATKADLGPGYNITVEPAMNIDGAQALVVNGLPAQDTNRQLFMVHNDLLYRIEFVPNNPVVGDAYVQMEDAYAMIVNTFHFTK